MLLVGAEMGKGGIAAQKLAGMHAHHAAAERVVDAILNLVKSVQQLRLPATISSLFLSDSIAGETGPSDV